jgi:hypothetical protein
MGPSISALAGGVALGGRTSSPSSGGEKIKAKKGREPLVPRAAEKAKRGDAPTLSATCTNASAIVSGAAAGIKFVDIGANMTDPMFRGVYRGKRRHPDDFDDVLARSKAAGVHKIMVTAGCVGDAKEALELCNRYPDLLFCTIGCHPTRCMRTSIGHHRFVLLPGFSTAVDILSFMR